MYVTDLFSCIGGHAIGYKRAGFKPAVFCEIDPWRCKIIRRDNPGVPIIEDIHKFPWSETMVCFGGPPCQKTSIGAAIQGKRTGETLWPEMMRIVNESEFQWVVVEQPDKAKNFEAQVQGDLENDGWSVKWVTLSALELGAPHLRRRRFALAHRNEARLEIAWSSIPSKVAEVKRLAATRGTWLQPYAGAMRMDDGIPGGLYRRRRIEAIGDSNPPEMAEVIFLVIREAQQGPEVTE